MNNRMEAEMLKYTKQDFATIISIDNHKTYKVIVFANTYETPFSQMDAICEELKKHNTSSCSILFDMLLCRGNTSERFTEVFFDGDRIVKESIKYVKIDKDSEIRKISANFMRNNSNVVNDSILTSLQQTMIKKGIAI